VISFLCSFSCSDSLTMTNEVQVGNVDDREACDKSGPERGFIMMPWYPIGSIESYRWKENNFGTLKSLVKQVLCAYLAAFERCGFVHGDFHSGNIVIRGTSLKSIDYGDFSLGDVCGKYAMMMDFQKSATDCPASHVANVYRDFSKMFQSLEDMSGSDIVIRCDQACIDKLISNANEVPFDAREVRKAVLECVDKFYVRYSKSVIPKIPDFSKPMPRR
jgi:predicted unusual protein kinase regulating ubiquinone biosynthesis (AarF/ABC1/UbiB family)